MGIAELAIGPAASLISQVVDRLFPDKVAQAKEREELLLKAQELDNQLALAQTSINQTEASSASLFVAGWRPFIGWVCGLAFAYQFIIQPFLAFIIGNYTHQEPLLPEFDTDTLSNVLYGMLGLGTLRSVDKALGNGESAKLPWRKKNGN